MTATQTVIRWSRLGAWERLLVSIQERGVRLRMAFFGGISVRAHHKATGYSRKKDLQKSETAAKLLADLVADTAPRPLKTAVSAGRATVLRLALGQAH